MSCSASWDRISGLDKQNNRARPESQKATRSEEKKTAEQSYHIIGRLDRYDVVEQN